MDWTKVVKTFAPTIAGAIGGPVGPIAAWGVSELCQLFWPDDPSKPSQPDVMAQIGTAVQQMTPDQALALKDREYTFKENMKKLDIQVLQMDVDKEKIASEDRQSARTMQIQTNSWLPHTLAVVVTTGFFGLLAVMCWHDIPGANRDILNVLLGSLGAAWVAIINFFFGSTSSSARKDEYIANSIPASSVSVQANPNPITSQDKQNVLDGLSK